MNKGFTLIEILVAMVTMSILFLGGYTVYRDFARRQIVENTYKELRTNLAYTRELALSGEKPSGCVGVLDGYQVAVTADSYAISVVCDNTVSVKVITLASGMSISGIPTFMYKVLGQGTNLAGEQTVTITQAGTGRSITAYLTKEGVIERR